MLILLVVIIERAAVRFKPDMGAAQVHVGWKLERRVKAAEDVRHKLAFRYFIVGCVFYRISHLRHSTFQRADITALACAHAPDPSLQVDFLAGAVKLAIIKHVPAKPMPPETVMPAPPVEPGLHMFR